MIPKNRLKPDLTVAKIGKRRFWIGIIIGILYSFSLCLFFNYSREILRFLSGSFSDIITIDTKTSLFFNIFFATFSTAIGFSIISWFWTSGIKGEFPKQRLYNRLSQVNSTLIIWIPLMMITRIGSILFVILYTQRGYDSNLKLIEEFKFLFLMLPLVIFCQNWISIRRIFKTNKWIIYSFVAYSGVSLIVFLLASVKNKTVDISYSLRYQNEFEFIDNEVKRAKETFDINYSSSTIKSLKEWYTNSSIEQMNQVQKAFESNSNVSIDTIILQKIIVKNFKEGRWYRNERNSIENWPYVQPSEIKEQILSNKTNSTKLEELVSLLNEQISLINYMDKEIEDFEDLNQTERRKVFGAKYRIPKVVVAQMINVANELKNNIEVENLSIKLKEIK